MKIKLAIFAILQVSVLAFNLNSLDKSLSQLNSFNKENKIRIEHVKELLGKNYGRSIASVDADHSEIKKLIFQTAKKTLPRKYKKHAKRITNTIIEQSMKYKLDPVFLSAMIMNESSFNPSAKGTSGEIGLMQILPTTGKWMAKKIKMPWRGKKTLNNPVLNIKLGAAYVNLLRNKYKHGQLYLAAYNMGPGNLRRALRKSIRPKDYTVAVMKRYFDIYKRI
jgi:soluble lytic murein transglycosylase